MSFEASLANVNIFKKLIDCIKDLVKNLNLDISPTGLKMQTMDSAHVCLVHTSMNKNFFEQFKCENVLCLGVNVLIMSKLLKCSGKDDTMTIKANSDSDRIKFIYESKDNLTISDFYMNLCEIDQDELQIPKMKHIAKIRMPSSQFKRICNHMIEIGDSITIKVEDGIATFLVNGDSQEGSEVIRSRRGDKKKSKKKRKKKKKNDVEEEEDEEGVQYENSVEITCKSPFENTFALKYLNFFSKGAILNEYVTLRFEHKCPMAIEFELGNESYIHFYLSPMISDIDQERDNIDSDDDDDSDGDEY